MSLAALLRTLPAPLIAAVCGGIGGSWSLRELDDAGWGCCCSAEVDAIGIETGAGLAGF